MRRCIAVGVLLALLAPLAAGEASATSKTRRRTVKPVPRLVVAPNTPTLPSPAAARPVTNLPRIYGTGAYTVGSELPVGSYYSSGGSDCTWARLGPTGQRIQMGTGSGATFFVVDGSESRVVIICDAPFERVVLGPSMGASTAFPSATYRVGTQIRVGWYLSTGGPDCSWATFDAAGARLQTQMGAGTLALRVDERAATVRFQCAAPFVDAVVAM